MIGGGFGEKIPNISLDFLSQEVYYLCHYGGVAKLVIALACHAGDRGFEPRRSRKSSPRGELFYYLLLQ